MKEKNVKHLTKTLAVVSLLAPMTAQPLGIGDIQLHSALNEKLNAEIRLHLAPGENPSDVTVRLAPPEKFDKAGVPWNYFLSKIKFQTVEQSNGNLVIKVTSREPLTEPFLDFLLEVNWPQGTQFREFTVLLDPPADYRPPVIPSATTPAYPSYQVDPLDDYQPPVRKARTVKKRAARAPAVSNITPQTPTSGEYGPTQKSDTLWRIAEQLGSERGVPTRQMLTALYQANPNAFNRNDMDALKAGVVLKIPETDAILQSGKARPEQKVARKEPVPAPKPVVSETKQLELVAPTDGKVPDTAQLAEQTRPGAETGTPGSTGASPDSEAATGKDIALQDRIDRLEQQLNMMQQLLALKDQQLAALQSKDTTAAQQAAETAKTLQAQQPPAQAPVEQAPVTPETQATTVPAPAPTPAQPTPPAPAPEIKPAPVPQPPKPAPAAPVAAEESLFSSPAYYLTFGGLGTGILGALGWLWWRKRKIESQTNTESMFASASQIRLPDSDSSLSVPVLDMTSPGSYDVGTVGESSFISDFTPSDFEAFDTDQSEVDPLSEADVYLAYGRYQQAEDLIRHAIREQPKKDEYKLKLLEIFYANENKEGFAAYAQELADAGKSADKSFWTKVSDMAKEIVPNSPLFGGAPTPDNQASTDAPDTDLKIDLESPATKKPSILDSDDRFDFNEASDSEDDLVDLEAPTLPDLELMKEVDAELADFQLNQEQTEADDNSLDFDLSSFSEKKPSTSQTDAEESVVDIESIDFDLSGFANEPAEKPEPAAETPGDTLETFDFNFDFDAESSAENKDSATRDIGTPAVQEEFDLASLESFDFPELGSLTTEAKPASSTPELGSTSLETPDEFDFNFDFNAPTSESDDDSIDLGEVSDLTDMDEFETKIDLAKAYIDMGDAEAAKNIASEVLEKGNQAQKQAAQAILDELQ